MESTSGRDFLSGAVYRTGPQRSRVDVGEAGGSSTHTSSRLRPSPGRSGTLCARRVSSSSCQRASRSASWLSTASRGVDGSLRIVRSRRREPESCRGLPEQAGFDMGRQRWWNRRPAHRDQSVSWRWTLRRDCSSPWRWRGNCPPRALTICPACPALKGARDVTRRSHLCCACADCARPFAGSRTMSPAPAVRRSTNPRLSAPRRRRCGQPSRQAPGDRLVHVDSARRQQRLPLPRPSSWCGPSHSRGGTVRHGDRSYPSLHPWRCSPLSSAMASRSVRSQRACDHAFQAGPYACRSRQTLRRGSAACGWFHVKRNRPTRLKTLCRRRQFAARLEGLVGRHVGEALEPGLSAVDLSYVPWVLALNADSTTLACSSM